MYVCMYLTHFLLPVIIRPLWATFVSSLGVYVRSSIEGTEDSFEGRYDSDGAEKSLDSYVIQVTIMMHLAGSNFYKYSILSNKSF